MIVRPDPDNDNPLWEYFQNNSNGLSIHKWHHYFDIYHNHFKRFRGQEITLVEIGVCHGGSMQMWKHYFGPKARIYGIDVNPKCKDLEEEQIEIFIGNQNDSEFLQTVQEKVGTIDIFIDDGGHHPKQQIKSFETFYPLVQANGIFLVEDLHSNYWPQYDGELGKPGTFIEYAKNFIDQLHAWHSVQENFQADEITRTTTGIHFYDSVLVIEKHPSPARPKVSRSGIRPF
jgi:cephalosporin hydroxylase